MKESKIFSNQNPSEKVHYVYRVTIDGKYYIGKRTGFLNDLHTGRYKTSSKLVREKLQNGHHFSKIKIIQVFSTSKEALEYESRILTRVNAKANPKFLNQSNGDDGDFTCKQHTEKTKEKISKKAKEQFDINTEQGRKNLENHRNLGLKQFDPNTEYGRQQRKINSKSKKEYYKTEQGRKRREDISNKRKEYFNPETEEGRKRRENKSQSAKARYNPNTEQGRKQREIQSENQRNNWDKNTEEGRKRREHISNKRKEKAKEELQKRKDASILGDLMFDEAFIRQNLLITDNKNNPRFLWSVYSKLSGYCEPHINKEKRIGKLSFLHGIKSIKLSEEAELAKIKEIEAIIKSRNNEKE